MLEKISDKKGNVLGTKPVKDNDVNVVKDSDTKSSDLTEDQLSIMTTKELYEMFEKEASAKVINRVNKGYTVDELEKDAKKVFSEIGMIEMRTGVLVTMLKEAEIFKGKYKDVKYQEVRALAGTKKRGFELDTRDGVSWIVLKV